METLVFERQTHLRASPSMSCFEEMQARRRTGRYEQQRLLRQPRRAGR